MANYQILNSLGEVVTDSVSQEQLDAMIAAEEFQFFAFDDSDEANLIQSLAAAKVADPEIDQANIRIYNLLEEAE